jgi:hypothetical protein
MPRTTCHTIIGSTLMLTLLFLAGCSLRSPEAYSGRGPRPGFPCVIQKGSMSDCEIDGGVVTSKDVVCEPDNDIVTCPTDAKIVKNAVRP